MIWLYLHAQSLLISKIDRYLYGAVFYSMLYEFELLLVLDNQAWIIESFQSVITTYHVDDSDILRFLRNNHSPYFLSLVSFIITPTTTIIDKHNGP